MLKNIVKISKSQSRGDEISLTFLLLLILFFLIISLIRFTIVGKVLDDFLFSFLFGWMKYIIYLISFSLVSPLCFGYRIKCRFKYRLYSLLILIIGCWTTQTLSLIILEKNNLWTSYYNLNLVSITQEYVKTWWNTNAVINYHGFFASPLSFNNFSVTTFFPKYATGGIISNILTGIFNYGFFITNLFVNFISCFCLLCLIFFNKPFIFFSKIKQSFIFIKNKTQQRKTNELKQKQLILKKEKLFIDKLAKKSANNLKKETFKVLNVKQEVKNSKQEINQHVSVPSINIPTKQEDYFNENSYLTPFGKINPEKQKDVISNSKGTLIVKKSLEDSIFNREVPNEGMNDAPTNNEN